MHTRRMILILLAVLLCITGCAAGENFGWHLITQEEAKDMMDRDDDHIILDVRRQDEYLSGHIPGAILLPNEAIGSEPPRELPDMDQIILIYCRSGRRSKEAAQKLADMGYTNIYEFGGIIDWTGEITTEITRAGEEQNDMILLIGETEVPVTWEDNPSVDAIKELLPLTIEMSMYGGFEQVGPIEQDIVREDEETETVPGDIVLYAGNRIVVFYGHNAWAYTRLGHIDLTEQEMEDLLGHEPVTLTISPAAEE